MNNVLIEYIKTLLVRMLTISKLAVRKLNKSTVVVPNKTAYNLNPQMRLHTIFYLLLFSQQQTTSD